MNPKPIETKYKGYRFRSRLEARWAVYFDSLRIDWEYEKEGFHLPSGMYLPDFWLPQVSMWAEVKHGEFSLQENRLCQELSAATGMRVLKLDGTPSLKFYWAVLPNGLGGDGYDSEVDCLLDASYLHEGRFYVCPGCEPDEFDFDEDVLRAVNAARSARFEFGECG